MVFILSALWGIRIRGLWKLPDGRDWFWGKLGLVLTGGIMFNQSLIKFSLDLGFFVLSTLFGLRPNYSKSNEDNGDFFQKELCMHCCLQCPWRCSRPLSTHASTRDFWLLTGKSGTISCGDAVLFFWLLVCTRFSLCPARVCFPSPVEFLESNPTGLQSQILWGSQYLSQTPGWKIWCGS